MNLNVTYLNDKNGRNTRTLSKHTIQINNKNNNNNSFIITNEECKPLQSRTLANYQLMGIGRNCLFEFIILQLFLTGYILLCLICTQQSSEIQCVHAKTDRAF